MRQLILYPAVFCALAALSCGGSTPNPNDPQGQQSPPPGYGQPGYAQPGPGGYQQPPPGGGYQQPPPGGGYQQPPGAYPPPAGQPPAPGTQPPVGTQPPATQPPPPSGGGGSATPIDPTAAAAATPILTAMASKEVPGMQPEGRPFAGQFQEGQTLEQQFTLQANKCYSVVGVGVGIQELDISIVAQPAPMLPPTVLAQDNTTGPNATLGGKGACFKNPLPIGGPAKAVVKATKGAGMALAQIYVK